MLEQNIEGFVMPLAPIEPIWYHKPLNDLYELIDGSLTIEQAAGIKALLQRYQTLFAR